LIHYAIEKYIFDNLPASFFSSQFFENFCVSVRCLKIVNKSAPTHFSDATAEGWDCSLCGRLYRTKASLYFHRSTKHRDSVRKYQKF
jgi:hypothetical protein